MFRKWLEINPNACWADVIKALLSIGERAMAHTVIEEYSLNVQVSPLTSLLVFLLFLSQWSPPLVPLISPLPLLIILPSLTFHLTLLPASFISMPLQYPMLLCNLCVAFTVVRHFSYDEL